MHRAKDAQRLWIGLVLVAICLPVAATELTFDYDFRNREAVDEGYGDFVESAVEGAFSYGGSGGFTPRVTVNYGPAAADPSLFDVGFGDLVNVLFKDADNFDTMDVTLSATAGSVVRLRGFDLAAQGRSFNSDPTINSLQVLDGDGNVLFELAGPTIPTDGHNHYGKDCPEDGSDPSCSFFPVLEAAQLTIRFDSGNLGRDSDGIGIDNITFSQARPRGIFSGQKVINPAAAGARSITAADLDGDGDLDVLSAAQSDRKLAWHENLDGKGSFGPERLICSCFDDDGNGVCDCVEGGACDADAAVCDMQENLDFTSVVACDIDTDGDLDIVAGSDGVSQEIVWYQNDGAGRFNPRGACNPAVSGEGACQVVLEGSVDVVCADLGRTGTTDVVSAGINSRVIWVPNDGTGNFAEPVDVDTANDLETIDVGDFDDDGLTDVWQGGFSQLVVVENRLDEPSGGFTARSNIVSGSENIRALRTGDIDGDGDLDMVVAAHDCTDCPEGFVAAFLNDGSGSFTRLPDLGRGDLFEAVTLGDVDGDGDLDVLTGSPDELSWIENAGEGAFAKQRAISAEAQGTEAVLQADVDGDGDPDLVLASFDDGQVSWHQNKMIHRSAIFPAESPVCLDADADGSCDVGAAVDPKAVTLADVDGDGDLDAVVATGGGAVSELHLNDGDGNPWDSAAVPITSDTDDTRSLAVGDVNRDGQLDLLTGNSDGSIKLYLNDGDGDPWDTLAAGVPLSASPGETTALALGDLNGDGALDLVVGKAGDCTVPGTCRNVVYLSTAVTGAANPFDGVAPTEIGTDENSTSDVALGDVDADGDLDVAAGNSGDPDLLYLNDGNGGFAGAGLPVGGGGAASGDTTSLALADLNRDGRLDLVVATRGAENQVFFNDRDPALCTDAVGCDPWDTAAAVATGAATEDTVAVALADLEGDGDADVVVVNDGQGDLFQLNDGSGALGAGAALGISGTDPTRGIALGDVDADGDVDAVVVSPQRGVVYLENLGGHYGFATTDVAPRFAFEGETTPMLCLKLDLYGRPGDSTGRLISVDLQVTDINVADVAGVVDRLEIFRDIQGSCTLDRLDPVVYAATQLSLDVDGTVTATFPDVPDSRVAGPATFLVALSFKEGAVQGQPVQGEPKTIRVKHLASASLVQEANAGVELIPEPSADLGSGLTTVLDPIEVDEGQDVLDTAGTSLREAVEQANAAGDNEGRPDRIVLQADTTYTLSLPLDQGGGPLEIDEIVVEAFTEIRGAGMGSTIIDAGCQAGGPDCLDRVFKVLFGGNLTLRDLTIIGGDGSGAAILNAGGQVTLINVEITQNAAVATDAPLVNSNGGQLTISSSNVSANEGQRAGCLINESGSTADIVGATLSNNLGGEAGCVLNEGTMEISNTTLSGNATIGSGGAIHNTGTLTALGSSTVVLNAALMHGGGIFNSGTLSTSNTILAQNAAFQSGPDCSGPVDSLGYNVVGNVDNCSFTPPTGSTGDQLGVDPRILPLRDNGGPTLTHALLPSSPAIDRGNCPGSSADQRGVARPLDVPGFPLDMSPDSLDSCDVGAAEMNLDQLFARIRIPVRWCVLSGTNLAADQQLANDTLDDWLQEVSDDIFNPSAGAVLFPAASPSARDWVIIPDPDTSIGQEGDVFVDPDRLDFDEFHQAIAACRTRWEELDPDVSGLTAVAIRGFIDGNNDTTPLQGIGGRAPCFNATAQAAAGRVMVVEAPPENLRNHVLAHEFGHALCLQHGDGLDDDDDGDPNDADDASAGKSLLDGPNLMQYRGGEELTLLQALLAREHAVVTIPDLQLAPPTQISGSSDGFGIEPRHSPIFEFGMSRIFEFRESRLFEFRESLLFEFRESRLFEFRESQLFEFRESLLFEFRESRLFEFRESRLFEFEWLDVAEFGAAFDSTTTTFYTSTNETALPPPLLPETSYWSMTDADDDDATGGVPSDHGFPLGTDENDDGVSDERGVDLITKVTLRSSCDIETQLCEDFLDLALFDWDGATFVEVLSCVDSSVDGRCDQIVSCLDVDGIQGCDFDPDQFVADIEPLSVGLVQTGGDSNFITEERKTQGMKVGFSLPTPTLEALLGQSLPAVPQFRIEVLTEVVCSTDPNQMSILPNGEEYACVCTEQDGIAGITCDDCPNDPGCLAGGEPLQPPVRERFEADFGVDTVVFDVPELPQCEIVSGTTTAGPGSVVTVTAANLPALESVRVATRDGETLLLADGNPALGSTDANGEAEIADVVVPANVIAGEFEMQVRMIDPDTGEDRDAIRAGCFLILEGGCVDSDDDGICELDDVCPDVPDPANDADGDGLCAPDDNCPAVPNGDQTDTDGDGDGDVCDTDDDNDGVSDGVDTAALDPNACADGDADGCDDCSVGTDGFGPLADNTPANDGTDTDGDGACDAGDADDDNDGIDDLSDPDGTNPSICGDSDGDSCDDCSVGTDGFGPLADNDPANDGTDTDGDAACDAGDADDDNDGVADSSDPNPSNPDICGDGDFDGCEDCIVGTDDFGPLADSSPFNDGPDTDADGLCDGGDADDDNDGVADGSDPDPLNPDICGDGDADTCDDCAVGTDNFGPLADADPFNDGLDADADGICDAGEATLTVIKQVTNDDGGTLDPHDFTIETTGSAVATGTLSFRGDTAGTVIDLDPGSYEVTENPKYDGFYGASFSADCSGQIAPGEAKTCTVTNDDLLREQTSSRVDSVSASLSDSGEGSRDVISGEFVLTDQSSGPQGLTLLLSDYEIDFEYKKRKRFETSDPVNDTFSVNGQTIHYACEYSILANDVPGATDGFESGDPVEFDESITIGYSCRLCTTVVAGECSGSESLPSGGTLKVTAGAMIFGRPDFTYTLSPTFQLTSGGLE